MNKKQLDLILAKRQAKIHWGGRIITTWLINGVGAPFIDKAKGFADRSGPWHGVAIQVNPFRFQKGRKVRWERKEGLCFVIGIIHS